MNIKSYYKKEAQDTIKRWSESPRNGTFNKGRVFALAIMAQHDIVPDGTWSDDECALWGAIRNVYYAGKKDAERISHLHAQAELLCYKLADADDVTRRRDKLEKELCELNKELRELGEDGHQL